MGSLPRGAFFCILVLLNAQIICAKEKNAVVSLDDSNWDDILRGHWMVEFYAPWCPACQSLQSQWEAFAAMSNELTINVGQVDVTKSPGLSGRFMVTALPTIYHVLDGEFRQYRSARTKEEFVSFIKEEKWTSVEPVPGWKSPDSFQMAMVSYLFKLSMVLRSLHTQLMEEYGLPTWGSYLIFAIATIIMGAVLGIVLVALIDHFYPPKPHSAAKPVVSPELKKKKKKTQQELGEDASTVVDDDVDKLHVDDDDEEEEEEEDDDDDDDNDDEIKDDLQGNVGKLKESPKKKKSDETDADQENTEVKMGSEGEGSDQGSQVEEIIEEKAEVTESSEDVRSVGTKPRIITRSAVRGSTNIKDASEEPKSAGSSPRVTRRRMRKAD